MHFRGEKKIQPSWSHLHTETLQKQCHDCTRLMRHTERVHECASVWLNRLNMRWKAFTLKRSGLSLHLFHELISDLKQWRGQPANYQGNSTTDPPLCPRGRESSYHQQRSLFRAVLMKLCCLVVSICDPWQAQYRFSTNQEDMEVVKNE